MSTPLPEEQLERGLGLTEAVALNMNAMVGIGPFIVIPLVIQAMGGPQCLLAWVAGAVLSCWTAWCGPNSARRCRAPAARTRFCARPTARDAAGG